tara:strand:- start:2231 stop:2359 length:129 start_codon:yes stop_codon:yes gene_type:complete
MSIEHTQPSRLALVARLRDNSRDFYGITNATFSDLRQFTDTL